MDKTPVLKLGTRNVVIDLRDDDDTCAWCGEKSYAGDWCGNCEEDREEYEEEAEARCDANLPISQFPPQATG